MQSPLLTVVQVAEMLNVKPSTVYEWARMEYLPSVQLGIGAKKPCVRFDQGEIERWLEAKRKAGRITRLPEELALRR